MRSNNYINDLHKSVKNKYKVTQTHQYESQKKPSTTVIQPNNIDTYTSV